MSVITSVAGCSRFDRDQRRSLVADPGSRKHLLFAIAFALVLVGADFLKR